MGSTETCVIFPVVFSPDIILLTTLPHHTDTQRQAESFIIGKFLCCYYDHYYNYLLHINTAAPLLSLHPSYINVWWLCLSLFKHAQTSKCIQWNAVQNFHFLIIWVCLEKKKAPIHTQIPSAGSFITQGFRVWEGGGFLWFILFIYSPNGI